MQSKKMMSSRPCEWLSDHSLSLWACWRFFTLLLLGISADSTKYSEKLRIVDKAEITLWLENDMIVSNSIQMFCTVQDSAKSASIDITRKFPPNFVSKTLFNSCLGGAWDGAWLSWLCGQRVRCWLLPPRGWALRPIPSVGARLQFLSRF